MQDLSELIESARQDFAQAEQPAALEDAKAKYIGKSGAVTALMKSLGQLAPEERRARGQEINKAKAAIESVELDPHARELFDSMADFFVERLN